MLCALGCGEEQANFERLFAEALVTDHLDFGAVPLGALRRLGLEIFNHGRGRRAADRPPDDAAVTAFHRFLVPTGRFFVAAGQTG